MADSYEVTGVFRDPGQARSAARALGRHGMVVRDTESLPQDGAGVHLHVATTGLPEEARQLLLRYGAYSAVVTGQGPD